MRIIGIVRKGVKNLEYIVSKLYRGGVVIPKNIRNVLKFNEGDFIKVTVLENGKIELEKIEIKEER